MELSSILIALVFMLGATAICVILFERLGFGSVLGFIVAGIIIGPHTPGLVASQNVNDLQNVAELGVVLFLFTVGLEMLPRKVWAMRRLLFGLGSAQMLATAAILGVYLVFFGQGALANGDYTGFWLCHVIHCHHYDNPAGTRGAGQRTRADVVCHSHGTGSLGRSGHGPGAYFGP